MSKEPIIGSGFRGAAFEQKGMQERNLALLLKSLSNKETQKSIEALSKIERDEWKSMAITATMLNNFVSLGGASALTNSIKETIQLQIDSLLSGLTNEINQAITDQLAPFIADLLTPMINDLNSFISENATGAGIGGIVGSIVSFFIPGGQFWVVLGAVIGAILESGYDALDATLYQGPSDAPYHPDITALYEAETGRRFTHIFDPNYVTWYNSRTGTPSGSLGSSRDQTRLGGPVVDDF